jgi:beta-lactamase class A
MSHSTKNNIRTIVLNRSQLLILLALAFCLGVYADRGLTLFGPVRDAAIEQDAGSGGGELRFIRYAARIKDAGGSRGLKELKPFRYKVKNLVDRKLKAGGASVISVYFRDLRDGHRFGIREQEKFSADTLLKLPLMIAYLKWADASPLLMNRKIVYTDNHYSGQGERVWQQSPFEEGRSYKVSTLLYRMIAYNDNGAAAVLTANLPPGYLQKIFKDIYVNYDPAGKDDAMSFNTYASFYRVLFNASYLSREMSERALRYLSKTAFKDGIVSGVPSDIDVVAKYGERMVLDPGNDGAPKFMQLHEFGIVYHSARPYMIGVMVRGDDAGELAKIIRDISALIYEEVDRQSR